MNTDVESRILYEDNHLIIVNKLPGEPVQGDQTGDKPLVESVRDYIRGKGDKPGNVFCGLVHRIDRPVSGAVIFAKTSKALSRMNELIKQRKISKIYWAIVEGKPEQDAAHLTHFLRKNEKLNQKLTLNGTAPYRRLLYVLLFPCVFCLFTILIMTLLSLPLK